MKKKNSIHYSVLITLIYRIDWKIAMIKVKVIFPNRAATKDSLIILIINKKYKLFLLNKKTYKLVKKKELYLKCRKLCQQNLLHLQQITIIIQ